MVQLKPGKLVAEEVIYLTTKEAAMKVQISLTTQANGQKQQTWLDPFRFLSAGKRIKI